MLWPLVGRDRELELLEELLSSDASGGLVVTGPAGVGKTRLALEAARVAESRGCAVEWVRATRSAATMPMGAFAAMLDPDDVGPADVAAPGGALLIGRARHALVTRAPGRRLVLCVDDGHLLDPAAATLVHQLAARREAVVVVTVRSGEPTPDALRALWKDDVCRLLELGELGRPDVERLLDEVLGGALDGRSAVALWERTRGNALFLHELVRFGLDRRLLADDGGIWRWRGPMAAGLRLAELVAARLDGVDSRAAATLELVAVGAPLEVAVLDADEASALEALEVQDLVVRAVDGRRRVVDVAHPLHADVVRARLSTTRLEALARRLAAGVGRHGVRRRADVPRVAAWLLESGDRGDPDLFERAAWQALAALDHRAAERFARASLDVGGGFAASLALARALAGAGRATDAGALLEDLERRATTDDDRAAVALATARNVFWGLDRAADAHAALRRAERSVADRPLRDELAAQRVRIVAAEGRAREALAAAATLLDDPEVGERARVQAAVAATEALLSSGRTGEAVHVADTWLPAARRQADVLPIAEPVLSGQRALALRFAGRLVEATEASEQVYAETMTRWSSVTTGVEASSLALIWLARGQVRTALRFATESATLLRGGDSPGMLGWALSAVAQAAAQAGDGETARLAGEELERTRLGHKGFESEVVLGRAWAAAAVGMRSRAVALARDATRLASMRGQDAYALRALHEGCRLGDAAAAAPQLDRLAAVVDGSFGAIAAAHAAALVARDGPALLEVVDRFAAVDALLVAAEAADAAAWAFRRVGRESSARTAAARCAALLQRCQGARPPALRSAAEAGGLTPREREVAALAAGGLSSAEIADRLVVSVRTVDNHLQRAYRKLGVTRRQDLTRALAGGP